MRRRTMDKTISSQRTEDFRGGIQLGATAYDDLSREMNIRLTRIKKSLATELSQSGYSMKVKINENDHAVLHRGCSPDGGIWFDATGKAIVAFESKKQGVRGNAHERWFKNFMFISHIYNGIRYVTFVSGKGCDSNMGDDFRSFLEMQGRKTDILYPDGASFFLSQSGFTDDEVREIMRKAVVQ